MKEEILVVENGVMKQEENLILNGMFLHLYAGEINGILFDDILERRLFIQFMKGKALMQSGKLYWQEEPAPPVEMARILGRQTALIERNSKLIHSIEVADNIFLFSDKVIFTRQKAYREQLEQLKAEYGVLKNAARKVKDLSAKDQVIVELLKACVEQKKIVILDDLSSFLQNSEIDEICGLIRRLPREMTFLIIIGFEDTGIQWMDRITVVQNGRTLAVTKPDKQKIHGIFEALLNKHAKADQLEKQISMLKPERTQGILEFRNASAASLQEINFRVESGEILKICYLDERSRQDIKGLLQGLITLEKGELLLQNKAYRPGDIHGAIKKGVCFVAEVPYRNMLLDNMTVAENLSIPLHDKVWLFWLRMRFERSVEELTRELLSNISGKEKLSKLDAATLQKIAYAKWILYAPKVVVCENPFLELDLNMREITLQMLETYKKMGIAVVILTSNLYTINNIEGEVLYLSNGRLIDEDEAYQRLYQKGDR